ncbi:unnamed protein product [Periconia digitata]|uniref:Glutamyl-tRNA synthetase n=1 Tax=Periconia digitata TaxID=1303443 RepID=A0A9W4XL78_9PLEO|nr:unnamed protein product [Periconia digitata]
MLQLHPSLRTSATIPRTKRWGGCGAQTNPPHQQHHHPSQEQFYNPYPIPIAIPTAIQIHPSLRSVPNAKMPPPPTADESPYSRALAAIDAAHALDPNKTTSPDSQEEIPYELHYAQKCTAYLDQHTPTASPALRLAIRAQHFRRWEVPRSSYPMTRIGYHAWRTFLKKRQAELVKAICIDAGYDEATAERVGALIRKEGLREEDEETVVLEDVACLVFLDDQFDKFQKELADEEKILGILRKTWGKMGERGREMALEMEMQGRSRELVEKALAG